MAEYAHRAVEKKWQAYWERDRTFRVVEDPSVPREKRRYVLDMFPYPSSAGLHVGHPEGYTATDIYCRYLRANGYHVLHPMGFDSLGLPAEQYAIQTGTHPRVSTEANIDRFREQIKSLGFSYDWDREVATHRADYYKWTQWIFLKLWEKGLAYEAEVPVWYCEGLGTVLANEEVIATPEGLRSERGNFPVERRPLRQWMLRITAYADRLLDGLDRLDWPESIKTMQRNWIGRSIGANVRFALERGGGDIEVFTTRPDTLFGATYMVLAPEHALVERITTAAQRPAVQRYVEQARSKSDLERTDLAKEKTGVFTGGYAINPVNGARIPVWISDYILVSYGTGAIMAVPAHDERDFAFAKTFRLPIVEVVARTPPAKTARRPAGPPAAELREAFVGDGWAVNSGPFDGLPTEEFKNRITAWLEERGLGGRAVNYKLRDWVFSRQRYWGEPIPLLHTADGEIVAVPYDQLPVELPEVDSYRPTGTAESPLAAISSWVNTVTPDGRPAKRETNTMPQWAGSCWYYLRYLDPHNDRELASRAKIDYWMPVDLYVGGAEHAVLHLLYARFWHKVLFDIGVVNTDEPFVRLVNQGMILGEGGVKMSKSLGNVINPDEIVAEYGADTMRMYEMFMGPLEASKPWSTRGIVGVRRFVDRIWRTAEREITEAEPTREQLKVLHQTIRKVGEDTSRLEFNTAIAQMMVFVNEVYGDGPLPRRLWEPFVLVLAPYAPHLAEELWERLGHAPSVSKVPWPAFDEELAREQAVTVVVQVNGRVRDRMEVAAGTPTAELERRALALARIRQYTDGRQVAKVVVVPDRLVNVVVQG